jgi:hypothetical protein
MRMYMLVDALSCIFRHQYMTHVYSAADILEYLSDEYIETRQNRM